MSREHTQRMLRINTSTIRERSSSPRLTMATMAPTAAIREDNLLQRLDVPPLRDTSRRQPIAPSTETQKRMLTSVSTPKPDRTDRPALQAVKLVSVSKRSSRVPNVPPMSPQRRFSSNSRASMRAIENIPPPAMRSLPSFKSVHSRSSSETRLASSNSALTLFPKESPVRRSDCRASDLFVSPMRRPKSALSSSSLNPSGSRSSFKSSSSSETSVRLSKKVSFSAYSDTDDDFSAEHVKRSRRLGHFDSIDDTPPADYPSSLSFPVVRSLLDDEVSICRSRSGSHSTVFSDSGYSETGLSSLLPYTHVKSSSLGSVDSSKRLGSLRHKSSQSFSAGDYRSNMKSLVPLPSPKKTKLCRQRSSYIHTVDLGLDDRYRPPLPPLPKVENITNTPSSTIANRSTTPSIPHTTSEPPSNSPYADDMKTPTLDTYRRSSARTSTLNPINPIEDVELKMPRMSSTDTALCLAESSSVSSIEPLNLSRSRSSTFSSSTIDSSKRRARYFMNDCDLLDTFKHNPTAPSRSTISFGSVFSHGGMESQGSLLWSDSAESMGSLAHRFPALKGRAPKGMSLSTAMTIKSLAKTDEIKAAAIGVRKPDPEMLVMEVPMKHPAIITELLGMVEEAMASWQALF